MSKIATLLGVCLTLSACVVYAPTYVVDTQDTVVHYESTSRTITVSQQKTNEVSERVSPKVVQRDQRTLADCGAFILPREAQKPHYMTVDDMATAPGLAALDDMLGAKMKELQTHIDKLHSEYEQAHLKWMEACQKKLLN